MDTSMKRFPIHKKRVDLRGRAHIDLVQRIVCMISRPTSSIHTTAPAIQKRASRLWGSSTRAVANAEGELLSPAKLRWPKHTSSGVPAEHASRLSTGSSVGVSNSFNVRK